MGIASADTAHAGQEANICIHDTKRRDMKYAEVHVEVRILLQEVFDIVGLEIKV